VFVHVDHALGLIIFKRCHGLKTIPLLSDCQAENNLFDITSNFWHGEGTQFIGAAPASKVPNIGTERGFLVCNLLSDHPGYREALGVPMSVSNGRAFLLHVTQNTQFIGGTTMFEIQQATPVVSIVNNQVITTSKDVSRFFGKRHDHVIETVRSLDIPNDFRQRNFAAAEYLDDQGKDQPMFNLTRDGFTILVMGFSGKKAMQFKLAYIEAFNLMEAQLMQQRFPELPPPTLTPDQQRRIQKIIGDKVYATGNKAMYPAYFKHIYRGIKEKFHGAKYDQIPAHLFDDSVAYINSATLTKESDTVTREEIENLKKMFVSYMEANVKPVSEAIISLSSRSVLLSRQLNDLKKDYLRAHGGSSFSERISNISGEAISMSKEFIHVATESRLNQLELRTALLCA